MGPSCGFSKWANIRAGSHVIPRGPSVVPRDASSERYLVLVPVPIRAHWGMGPSCVCFLPGDLSVREGLGEDVARVGQRHMPRRWWKGESALRGVLNT